MEEAFNSDVQPRVIHLEQLEPVAVALHVLVALALLVEQRGVVRNSVLGSLLANDVDRTRERSALFSADARRLPEPFVEWDEVVMRSPEVTIFARLQIQSQPARIDGEAGITYNKIGRKIRGTRKSLSFLG